MAAWKHSSLLSQPLQFDDKYPFQIFLVPRLTEDGPNHIVPGTLTFILSHSH